jgi:hypothetical protein
MVPPLLDANNCVGIYLSCVALPNLSRNGLLLKDGGRTSDRKRCTSQKKTARRNEPCFLTQRVSNDTPN